MDTRTSPARLHIERIRAVLEENGCAAALIPSSDPHLSEYLPERWQGRQWASGFTGSVGTLALTLDKAALFVDSRYWVQAERELAGSGIDLVKTPSPVVSSLTKLSLSRFTARSPGERGRNTGARARRGADGARQDP